MLFQTMLFILFIILTVISIIGFIVSIRTKSCDSRYSLVICLLTFGMCMTMLFTPNEVKVYLETDYNLSKIINKYDGEVIVKDLPKDEYIDYITYEKYIFGREKMILKTDDTIKNGNINNISEYNITNNGYKITENKN